jgi:hypothetical protein
VQARGCRATRMAGQQFAQRRACGDRLTGAYPGSHGLVGGSQPTGMPHGDHRSAGHQAGEEDGARPGAADHSSRRGGQVDAPVAGQPRLGWPVEAAHRSRWPVERPAEARGGSGRRSGSLERDRRGRCRWLAGHRRDKHRQTAELHGQREGHGGAEQHGTADRADRWLSHDGSLRPPSGRTPARSTNLWTTGGAVDDHPVPSMICYARRLAAQVTTTVRWIRSRSRAPRCAPTPCRSSSGRRWRGRRESSPRGRPRRW